jgi:hypothetical protein
MKTVTFDGGLYMFLGGCAFLLVQLSTDNAAKYIDPKTLWFLQGGVGYANAVALALKMFRSSSFSAYKLNGSATPAQSVALGIPPKADTTILAKDATLTQPKP